MACQRRRVGPARRRPLSEEGERHDRGQGRPISELRLDRPAGLFLVGAAEVDVGQKLEGPGPEIAGQTGVDPHVGEVDAGRGVKEHGASDPAVPPLVLVLDEGRIGPLHHAQGDLVGAGPDEARDVELRGQMGVLPDADLFTVERRDQDAFGCADVQDDAAIGKPTGWDFEISLVHAGGIDVRQVGRIAGERHLDVGVVRQVEEAPKRIGRSAHRPAAGDLDLAPTRRQIILRRMKQLEAPAAVERDPIEVRHRMHG